MKARLRPRRIIERPRLTRSLDASSARVRMLIAPAGYGKTTLAEQWTETGGRTAAWYPCRNSSADVAVLSLGLAQATSELLHDCDRRIRERLRATRNPPEEVETLAEILAEDLTAWPADGWLVIDDYHLVCDVTEAEHFVEHLIERSPINVLIASRQRPAWVSRRDVLYGEALELNQTQLAMIGDEADQVLSSEQSSLSTGLISLANGRPAVVGFASVTDVDRLIAGDGDPPEELYEFFVEGILKDLDDVVRCGLALLAVAPLLDRKLAATLLGSTAERVLPEALDIGLLVMRGPRLEMHPLVQTFLSSREVYCARSERQDAIVSCLAHYKASAEWDAALELIQRHEELRAERGPLLLEALDDMLEAAQITTIETWANSKAGGVLDDAICHLARGEVCLRQGNHASARVLAQRALRLVQSGDELEFRVLKLAGQAEHVCGREDVALEFFRRAEISAKTPLQRRDARWAQLMSSVAFELEDSPALFGELTSTTEPDNPTDLLRLSGRRICFDLIFGSVNSLDHARAAEQLLPYVLDPFLRCSFRNPYAIALALNASYDEALRVAEELIRDAREHKLELILPAGFTAKGMALAGLRDFEGSHEALDEAFGRARKCLDSYAEQNAFSSRMRVLAQERRFSEACAIEPPSLEGALPSMQGEVRASHGLVLACVGRFAEATESAELATSVTRGLEASTLADAIRCVLATEGGHPDASQRAEELVDSAFRFGSVDILVTCYRASPAVLSLLLRLPSTRERVLFAVKRAKDESIAESQGQSVTAIWDPVNTLSVREREICDLVGEGLSNREIARLLFISDATVKAHLHRVFGKLGVRSRQAVALRTAKERERQATLMATGVGTSSSDDG
jgi:LuxR family maltose regulon positive regulatory protein